MSGPDAIRLTRLPNGLTVVSETMPRVETVSFGAYVHAGTRNETAAENGVSHFLEHMAFKGTSKRDAAAIASVGDARPSSTSAPAATNTVAWAARPYSAHATARPISNAMGVNPYSA